MKKTVDELKIDPLALYTTGQAADMLLQVRPDLSREQAMQILQGDIASGKLPVAGYLRGAGR